MFNLGFTRDDLNRVIWTFIQGFVGGFTVAAAGLGAISDKEALKAAVIGLLVGGIAGGISAVKNLLLADSSAVK